MDGEQARAHLLGRRCALFLLVISFLYSMFLGCRCATGLRAAGAQLWTRWSPCRARGSLYRARAALAWCRDQQR